MVNESFPALLEERKEEIITTIEMVTEESFTPDFYGTYEIYINETDRQIYVFMTERGSSFKPKNPAMRYLHTIRSHAVKAGDFKEWLFREGILASDSHSEEKLKRIYRWEYKKFLKEIKKDALWEIVHADTIFTEIKDMYSSIAKGA